MRLSQIGKPKPPPVRPRWHRLAAVLRKSLGKFTRDDGPWFTRYPTRLNTLNSYEDDWEVRQQPDYGSDEDQCSQRECSCSGEGWSNGHDW